jgi:hypothetical protein
VCADKQAHLATGSGEMTVDPPTWEGTGPCDECGGSNIRWTAPYELWDAVMDAKAGVSTGGIKCPQCFVRRAWNKGLTDVNWSIVPVPKGFSVNVPLEGRAVPRYHYYQGEPRQLLRQWYATFIGTDGRWKVWNEGVRPSTATPPTPANLDELALLAETPTRGEHVDVNPISGLNLFSLFTVLVGVIHGWNFRRQRVVIAGHDDLPRRTHGGWTP